MAIVSYPSEAVKNRDWECPWEASGVWLHPEPLRVEQAESHSELVEG